MGFSLLPLKSACRATRALDPNFVDSEDTKYFNRHFKMASGVKVSEEVKQKYDDIKKKKCHRYLVFYIKDEKTIAVEKIGKREDTYEDFLADILACGPDDCRYGLFDFEYSHQCEGTTEKSKKEKLLLMSWCPDTAKIKKKMLYSSSFDALKKCLVGIQKYIQATDESEASRDEVEKQLRATDRQ